MSGTTRQPVYELARLATIVVCAIASRGTGAQSIPAETRFGALSGVVVDVITREPLSDALVYLRGGDAEPRTFLTDSKGRFLFEGVRQGSSYSLRALKVGFLEAQHGQIPGVESVAGSIHVDPGQWIRDLIIRLTPSGSISGSVRDESGAPVVGANVRVLRRARVAVGGVMQPIAGPIARTDDRGAYRISGLPPSEYYVQVITPQHAVPVGSVPAARDLAVLGDATLTQLAVGRYPLPATASDGRPRVYSPTFWPSSGAVALAQLVDLRTAERHRSGIDLTVGGMIAGRVSGRAIGPAGSCAGVTARLLLPGLEDLGESGAVATARLDSEGRFTFLNVPAGTFVLDVRSYVTEYSTRRSDGLTTATDVTLPRPPGQETALAGGVAATIAGQGVWLYSRTSGEDAYWGRESVTLAEGQSLGDVAVPLHRGSTVSGKFVRDREGLSPPAGLELIALAADGRARLDAVRSKPGEGANTFVIDGLAPGRYVLSASPRTTASGMRIKSVRCGSYDYTYKPIDTAAFSVLRDCIVTLTDQTTQIEGTVAVASGDSAIVIAFPVEPDQWTDTGAMARRFAQVAADANSKFHVNHLPAGDYFLTTISGDDVSAWLEPDALAKLAVRAVRVSVTWGNSVIAALKAPR